MRSRKKRQVPDYLAGGVDIIVDKSIDSSDGSDAVSYFARVCHRNQPTFSIMLTDFTMLMDSTNIRAGFPTEEKLAEAISDYVNDTKKQYSLAELDYKIKVIGEKVKITEETSEVTDELTTSITTIKKSVTTKLTDEECDKVAKSIEDLLK